MSQISSNFGVNTQPTTGNGYSDLTSEEFVKIMFTELSNQDPMKPNDSNQLLQQMSSLRSIQSNIDLQNKLTQVVSQQQFATAGALIGKRIMGLTELGDPVSGTVQSVSQTVDGPVLTLPGGTRIPFSQVDTILEGAPAPAPTGTNNTNTSGSGTP